MKSKKLKHKQKQDKVYIQIDFMDSKIKLLLYFFLVLFSISSCKENNTHGNGVDNSFIYKKYYPNGKLSLLQNLIVTNKGDTIEDGIHKEYDSLGNLAVEAVIKLGERNGYMKNFYPDGSLSYLAYYKNDTIFGYEKFFYKDGSLKFKGYYLDGHQFGKQIYYDTKGGVDSILFYNLNDRAISIINFDKLNHPKIRGTEDYLVFNKQTLKVGDSLIIINYLLNHDFLKSKLNLSIINSQGKNIMDTIINEFQTANSMSYYPFEYVFKEKGEYNYQYKVTILDDRTGKTLSKFVHRSLIHVE